MNFNRAAVIGVGQERAEAKEADQRHEDTGDDSTAGHSLVHRSRPKHSTVTPQSGSLGRPLSRPHRLAPMRLKVAIVA